MQYVWYIVCMKTCNHCHKQLPETEFYRNCTRKDGLNPHCKECGRESARRTYHKQRNETPEAHSLKRYSEGIKSRYGIDIGEYNRLLASQNWQCAVCKADRADATKARLHVDHNHQTGRVRGLLCTRCNNALGYAADNAERLRQLATYLESYATPVSEPASESVQ